MAASLKELIRFDGANGNQPVSNLVADASGDLFGTTSEGGTNDDGIVFELVKTATGYAAPVTLVTFDGETPGGLAIDGNGNLFGTTEDGGTSSEGTVFEIAKAETGYASAPTTLVSFDGTDGKYPDTTLTIDADGNLLGTTSRGGAYFEGTVFEVAKTETGYASAPTTLVNFTKAAGGNSSASLFIDSNGNLIGTASLSGTDSYGKVYEIAKTATGYAKSATTLVNFNFNNGATPEGGLVADSRGNLYGTTDQGGPGAADGTIFEIAKTAHGYASTPTILFTFDTTDGSFPDGSLTIDANGDLFGTTSGGGANNEGTAFELKKTATGYSSTVTTLVTFGNDNGKDPQGSLLADANGNLFGTTLYGGGSDDGTIFEITGSGFATGAAAATADVVSPLAGGSNAPAMTFLAPASTDQSQTTPPAKGWNFFAELQTSQLLAPTSLTSLATASAGLTHDVPATGFSPSLHLFDTSTNHLAGASTFKGWLL
jgi:uncharacterized repeat protein (TIGR03803 family)